MSSHRLLRAMFEAMYEPEVPPATDVASVADLPSATRYVLGAFCDLGDGWHEAGRVVERTESLFRAANPAADYDNSALWRWAIDALAEADYLERRDGRYRLALARNGVAQVLRRERRLDAVLGP